LNGINALAIVDLAFDCYTTFGRNGYYMIPQLRLPAGLAMTCGLLISFAGPAKPVLATTALPTVSISISPATIAVGSSAVLTWSATNGTSCLASGAWSGPQQTFGSESVMPATAGTYTYTLVCQDAMGDTATASTALTVVPPISTSPLGRVRSFEYILEANLSAPGVYAAIANSPIDLFLLGSNAGLNRAAADPSGSKLIFGYVDVAEAASYAEPSLFASGPLPSWMGNQNPGYPGLYTVQYWNPAWEPLLFSVIDKVVTEGYDGIFLDVLDGDTEWSIGNIEGNPVYPNAVGAMTTLLSDIRNYISKTYPGKSFYLIGNNPTEIASANPGALRNLDAIFNEVAFYRQIPANGHVAAYIGTADASYTATATAPLYAAAGVPVFGNDYPTPLSDMAACFMSFSYYNSLGWIPSVVTPDHSTNIFSTGPFMFMATPANPTVFGSPNYVNFISGGMGTKATLIGGNQGDYFIGGPGQNAITAGAGNDTIYAHPVSAGEKGKLIIDFSSTLKGIATIPSVSVAVNGGVTVPSTPITAANGTSTQTFITDATSYGSISSVVITVTNTSFIDQSNFSNIEINDIIYNGVAINLASGAYSSGSGSPFVYSNKGTVTFSASSFAVGSPFLADTSDVIDGGAGMNSVIYRGVYKNYNLAKQADGSWLVTSSATAEGPDKLTNIQTLVFSDQRVILPANGASPIVDVPPIPIVVVDGHNSGDTITIPSSGGSNVVIRFDATDPSYNLSGIRFNIWNPPQGNLTPFAGFFNNNGGIFAAESGGSGEADQTVSLTPGDWYFWTDAQNSAGDTASSGSWMNGFVLHVVQAH
jgi:uncharacterized protein (TIGR01370 family)